MRVYCTKNISLPVVLKALLLSGLLLFSLFLQAQEEENVPTITDTTIVEEVTGEDEPGKTDAVTSTDTYFNKRSDTLTIEQRNIPPAVVKKIKEDGAFWYVNTDLKGSQKDA
ncbi:MAG: hypothetical protein H7Y01_02470, partial [Ferruginibacter sp.]|nr:hypothetical protein [Chitinophagaceae bacterium]